VVEAHNADVVGHPYPLLRHSVDEAERHLIIRGEDSCRTVEIVILSHLITGIGRPISNDRLRPGQTGGFKRVRPALGARAAVVPVKWTCEVKDLLVSELEKVVDGGDGPCPLVYRGGVHAGHRIRLDDERWEFRCPPAEVFKGRNTRGDHA